MRQEFTRNAPIGFVCFAGMQLAIVLIGITAFGDARSAEPARPTPHPATPTTSENTFSRHATNIAVQSTAVADLHSTEQERLCEALIERHCDGTNVESCTVTINACAYLARLRDDIAGTRASIEAIYAHGFLDLETICDGIIATGHRLTAQQVRVRDVYRNALFEQFDTIGSLLRKRNEALDPLRAAARRAGGDALLAKLGIEELNARVRIAVEDLLRSLRVVQTMRGGALLPDRAPRDPLIPPCSGDVRCWEI